MLNMADWPNNLTDSASTQSKCAAFPDKPDYCIALACIRIISSVLSVLGCAFTIGLIWVLRKYRSFTQRMILHLSIAAMLLAFAYLMEGLHVKPGATCSVQAFTLTFAQWAVLLWIFGITANLCLIVVWEKSLEQGEIILVAGCWIVSAVIGSLPFADDKYGPAGIWCWIPQHWEWRFGIWYIPAFISVFVLFAVTIFTAVKIRIKTRTVTTTNDPSKTPLEEDILRLRAYPIVYLGCMLFPTINRLQNAISGDSYIFALLLLQTLTGPLLGATIAVVFGLDKDTFATIKAEGIRKVCLKRLRPQKKTTIREYQFDDGKIGGVSNHI